MPVEHEIVSDVRDWQASSSKSHQIVMGEVLQFTLFGKVVHGNVSASTLDKAYGAIAHSIASALGISEVERIAFFQATDAAIPRYHLSANVLYADGTMGYLKIGRGEVANASLKHEYRAITLAHSVSYPPTVTVRTPYTELSDELAFFELDSILFGRDGFTAVNHPISRLAMPSWWGHIVAESMVPQHDRPLPATIDTSWLRLAERELKSADLYLTTFREEQEVILSKKHANQIEDIVQRGPRRQKAHTRLRKLFDEVNESLPDFLYPFESPDDVYFAINDVAPHTVLFCSEEGLRRFRSKVVYYFLGLSGRTHNPMLASMFDWGNFVARCDPNTALQQAFLERAIQLNPLNDRY